MSVVSLKCPYCGGELIFDPSSQQYQCEYCVSTFSQEEIDKLKPAETKEETSSQVDESGESIMAYSCPSCGAEIVAEETTASTFCYYCHNPVVLAGKVGGEFTPDKIIPFKIDKQEAEKKFLSYVQGKKYIPRAFFNKKQIELLSGVYFPYWLYDCKLEGSLQAESKDIRIWRTGDIEHVETKFYEVEREGSIQLEDIPRNALKKANHKLIDGVMPYDLSEAIDFHMGYLSGFSAEKRDIESEEYAEDVKKEADSYGGKLLEETIDGHDTTSIRNVTMIKKDENWSYVLLPVWTVTYKGKDGKIYYYSLNGQDGKVFGELPVDYPKVWTTASIIAGVTFVISLIGGLIL